MKKLLTYFSYILIISAGLRLLPIVTAFLYNEPSESFFLGAVISLALGLLFLAIAKFLKDDGTRLSLNDGFLLMTGSYLLLSILGSISFYPSFNNNPINALFEATSGFTTTGLTMYTSVEHLPKSLLLWRAETQWVGGIGIIMVFLFILSRVQYNPEKETRTGRSSALILYRAQGFELIEPSLQRTTEHLLAIYGGYTVLGILLLLATGLSAFDAIAMTFTSLSTGGFTVHDAFYTQPGQLAVLSFLMLLGSISFIAHNNLLRRRIKKFFTDTQNLLLFSIIIIASFFVFLVVSDIQIALFEVISAYTTTGYTITKISALPGFAIAILLIGMIIGGSFVSTAGGIKIHRVHMMFKSIQWLLKRLSSPFRAIIPYKIHEKPVEKMDRLIVHSFIFTYLLIIIIGTCVFLFLGFSFLDSLFQVSSALGTVGLTTFPLHDIPVVGKVTLMIAMFLGRLEIFPFILALRRVVTAFHPRK